MKTESRAIPPDLSVDDCRNWNFDDLPDSQLVACCFWEYARESATIRDGLKRMCQLEDDPENLTLRAGIRELLSGLRPVPRALLTTGARAFPKPWQVLTESGRKELLTVGGSAALKNTAPFELAAIPIAEFAKHCKHRWMHYHGLENLLVEINWRDFCDDDIARYFRKWVGENRPLDIPNTPSLRTKRSGHKLKDVRAHLRRLAAMRLLHRYTANDILGNEHYHVHCKGAAKPQGKIKWLSKQEMADAVAQSPDALATARQTPPLRECVRILETRQFGGKGWYDPQEWYEARTEAMKVFHGLFPALPAVEMPCSWPTKGSAA